MLPIVYTCVTPPLGKPPRFYNGDVCVFALVVLDPQAAAETGAAAAATASAVAVLADPAEADDARRAAKSSAIKVASCTDAALCLFQRVLEWGQCSSSDGSEELSVAVDADRYGPSFSEAFDRIDRLMFFFYWIDRLMVRCKAKYV